MAQQVNSGLNDGNNNNNNIDDDEDDDVPDELRHKPGVTTGGEEMERAKNSDASRQLESKPAVIINDEKCHITTAAAAATADEANRPIAPERANADQWHLLDVDGQSVVASSASSSSNELEGTSEPLASGKSRQQRRRLKRQPVESRGHSMAEEEKFHQAKDKRHRHEDCSPGLVLACTALYALMPLASFLTFLALIGCLFTKYWLITVLYYTYLILDSKVCNRGGRRFEAVYRSRFWAHLAAYFPIKLKHSANFKLNPSENYILNYHPHGIAAFGCVSAFATNGLNFSHLFPGIRSRFMVHETSFLVPVMRETFLFRGDCSVSSKSFDYILSRRWKQQGAGNLLALCGGGLAEADLSDAECLKVVVASRKGFVKKALIHGANLIPCIAFGENSVFTKVNFKPNSLLHRLESRFYSLFKFKHPIYYGASLLGNEKLRGVLPYRRPITVVMGDPIQVDRVEQPSQEQIDQLHARYVESLRSIYVNNKRLSTRYDSKMELV